MTLGIKLRRLREARQISQQTLAKAIDVAQSSIASYELDQRQPSFAVIQKLADYFGVSFASLVPSPDGIDDSTAVSLNEALQQNKKLGQLFEKAQYLTDAQLDAVLSVVNMMYANRPEV